MAGPREAAQPAKAILAALGVSQRALARGIGHGEVFGECLTGTCFLPQDLRGESLTTSD